MNQETVYNRIHHAKNHNNEMGENSLNIRNNQ